jgi:Protein of unknown function (DUF2924)
MTLTALEEIDKLDLAGLKAEWQNVFGNQPPRGMSSRLMVRALAYEVQARQLGGLKPVTTRKLNRISEAANSGKPDNECAGVLSRNPAPGTRLIREWNGVTHTVDVTDEGYEWLGQSYPSLSRIAREITGVRWSGPRFFGLGGEVAA